MGKKLENQPTSVLMTYQQMIGLANQQMEQFKDDIQNIAKEGTISETYVRETIAKIEPKIAKNGQLLADIETELFDRLKRDNKGVTTPEYLGVLFRQFHEEKAAHKERGKSKEKKESKTIKLDVETEKK